MCKKGSNTEQELNERVYLLSHFFTVILSKVCYISSSGVSYVSKDLNLCVWSILRGSVSKWPLISIALITYTAVLCMYLHGWSFIKDA